jgi:hypothetical protein
MTELERVIRALRAAGDRGITQVDFLTPDVIDGEKPITRLAARILELKAEGYQIEGSGKRDKCKVYVLAADPVAVQAPVPVPTDAKCWACQRAVLWVAVNDRPHPCDPIPALTPAVGMIARNPRRGTGKVLAGDDMYRVAGWVAAGVTLHRSHFSSCPDAKAHRTRDKNPGQEPLLREQAA